MVPCSARPSSKFRWPRSGESFARHRPIRCGYFSFKKSLEIYMAKDLRELRQAAVQSRADVIPLKNVIQICILVYICTLVWPRSGESSARRRPIWCGCCFLKIRHIHLYIVLYVVLYVVVFFVACSRVLFFLRLQYCIASSFPRCLSSGRFYYYYFHWFIFLILLFSLVHHFDIIIFIGLSSFFSLVLSFF